jgi:hypothetical protein
LSKVTIKEDLDNYIYRTYNMLSNILFSVSKYKKTTKKNISFKNIHAGKRCFLLGTGPSLRDLNYDYLQDEITFGVNFLYKGDIINHIKPQYYCLYDQIFHTTHLESTKELINSLPDTTFFLRTKAHDIINTQDIDTNNIYYQHCNLYQYSDYISVDMVENMTAPFNVVLGCIQTAIYMGFKEIYLLGCDFSSFTSLKVEHFYDYGKGTNRPRSLGEELKEYSMVSYHHYALEKYARENNVRIYNITPNSLLDAYERKSFEDIFNKND